MPASQNYDLYCPECDEKADAAHLMFIRYSVKNLELPIFLCRKCRTIYIDKPLVSRLINKWRKYGNYTKKMPFSQLHKEFLGELEESLRTYWVAKLGYREVRFQKRPNLQTP